jgi:hypothetical protein
MSGDIGAAFWLILTARPCSLTPLRELSFAALPQDHLRRYQTRGLGLRRVLQINLSWSPIHVLSRPLIML